MDRQFLEFWGNFFLAAAKGQKQMEEVAQWMHRGTQATGFEDVTAMFTKAYGLQAPGSGTAPEENTWETAVGRFTHAFTEYATLMGMVSAQEYRQLEEKYNALENKCADQEETIAHLRELLGTGKAGQQKVAEEFQAILEKQSSQFQQLIDSSSHFLKQAAKPPSPEKKRRQP